MLDFPWVEILTEKNFDKKYVVLKTEERKITCPAGIPFDIYLNMITRGEYEKATLLLHKYTPFPLLCGNICNYPCEKTFVKDFFEGHNSIKEIKKFASKYELSEQWRYPKKYKKIYEEKIAVIGGGVSGLSVAFDFCSKGYQVDVFEKTEKAGGHLWEIINEPQSRMLEKEIIFLQEVGINFILNKEIDSIENLIPKYSYIVIATGKNSSLKIKDIEYENNKIKVNDLGQSSNENIIAVGSCSKDYEFIPELIGKIHKIVNNIHEKKQKIEMKEKYFLPIIRPYLQPCPYRINIEKKEFDEISFISKSMRCLHCGLWEKDYNNFKSEGCINCALCDKCLSECNYKQVLIKTGDKKILAKTTKELALKVLEKNILLETKEHQEVEVINITANVNPEKCTACGHCEEVCPYGAIHITYTKGNSARSFVNTSACRSCGICVSACPNNAIEQGELSINNIYDNIKTSAVKNEIKFGCRWSGAFENFSEDNEIVKLMCSRDLNYKYILNAVLSGASKISLISCEKSDCHYLDWYESIDTKLEKIYDLFGELGFQDNFIKQNKNVPDYIKNIPTIEENKKINLSIGDSLFKLKHLETFAKSDDLNPNDNLIIFGIPYLMEKILNNEGIINSTIINDIFYILKNKNFNIVKGISGIEQSGKLFSITLEEKAIKNLKSILEKDLNLIAAFPEIFSSITSKVGFEKIKTLPEILKGNLKFKKSEKKIAIHKPCGWNYYSEILISDLEKEKNTLLEKEINTKDYNKFYEDSLELLSEINGIEMITLPDISCGQTFWEISSKSQKKIAYNLLHKAKELGIDTIITLSPYCSTYLYFTLRKGSWIETNTKVIDLYSFIKQNLED